MIFEQELRKLIGDRPIVCDTCGSTDVVIDFDKFYKSAEAVGCKSDYWRVRRANRICPLAFTREW